MFGAGDAEEKGEAGCPAVVVEEGALEEAFPSRVPGSIAMHVA